MGCFGKCCLAVICWIAQVLQAAISITIIIIVAVHLADYSFDNSNNFQSLCLLADTGDDSVCNYAYAVAGLSLACNLAMSILLCFTCNLCGLGPLLETIFNGFAAVWWVIAALIFSAYVSEANDNNYFNDQARDWRISIVVLAWVNFGLFTFIFCVYLGKMVAKICKCCGCCDDDDDKEFDKV
mmetsp:Transcript_19629/g.43337  ORF Transcript_19629/g.43337 Transcript_19629/m.43337 type:complete len:183 (-) Transcript_19629:235-783(-)